MLYTAETSTLNVYDLHLVELAQPGQSIIVNAAQQEEHRRLYVAAIGPNSKRFIYATMEDLEIESLYVVDISNPELQQRISPGLSEEARVWSPRFSPDGSAIAYIVSPDTSAAQRLYLSFVDRLSDPPIVVADAYRSFGRFDFTARGTHVVYSHRAADYSSVVLFDTSTSNKVVLYEQDGDHNYSVHLTPNRRFLYFGDTQLLDLAKFGISYYSEAEVAENPILTQEYTKAFSPDSRSLLRAPEDPDGGRYLLLTSVENQNTKTPVSPPATNSSFGYGMVFTPDGGSVVYRADFEGQSAYGGLYISAIDGSGEAKRLSTSTEHKVMSFRLSADGRFIAYVADEGYPTLHERGWTLYLLDQENGYVPVKQPGADSTALAEHVLWHRLEFVPPGPAYRD